MKYFKEHARYLLIFFMILSATTYAFDDVEPTFELPEPTATIAYIASAGGTVRVQLSVPFTIGETSYNAYDIAELTIVQSEEPQVITIIFSEAENKKIHISGDIVSARFIGFASYGGTL